MAIVTVDEVLRDEPAGLYLRMVRSVDDVSGDYQRLFAFYVENRSETLTARAEAHVTNRQGRTTRSWGPQDIPPATRGPGGELVPGRYEMAGLNVDVSPSANVSYSLGWR